MATYQIIQHLDARFDEELRPLAGLTFTNKAKAIVAAKLLAKKAPFAVVRMFVNTIETDECVAGPFYVKA